MIMYEAEHIKDSRGNQWSKQELKWWDFAHQLFQVPPHHLKELLKSRSCTWFTREFNNAKDAKLV